MVEPHFPGVAGLDVGALGAGVRCLLGRILIGGGKKSRKGVLLNVTPAHQWSVMEITITAALALK